MQALILAGGKGTRLRPLTVYTPKPIVPICNRPFLLYQIDTLRRAGVTDITLSLSYQPEKIEQQLGDGANFGVKVKYEGGAATDGHRRRLQVRRGIDSGTHRGFQRRHFDRPRSESSHTPTQRAQRSRHDRFDSGRRSQRVRRRRDGSRWPRPALPRKTKARREYLQEHQCRHLCPRAADPRSDTAGRKPFFRVRPVSYSAEK